MKKIRKNGHLYRSLQAMSVIPLLISCLIIMLFSYHAVENAMHGEIQTELKNVADSVILTYNLLYPGDYHLEGSSALDLYKGDTVITSNYSIIDRIKADTGIEITIFYQDTRILTTLCNEDGIRIVGTGASSRVINDVLSTGQPHFYANTLINDERYFSYYTPITNADNTIIGMVYTGMPRSTVDKTVRKAVYPILLIALCSMAVMSLITSVYTHKLIAALQKIRTFLSKVSVGNLAAELPSDILKRNDELSEIGYSAIYMQSSLRTLIDQDALTELNNRRFANNHLKQIQLMANTHGTSFVVVIGDIDYFKTVNDTYGHECGDMVLKKIAVILKKHMVGKGFAARWGGEEFLLVYDNTDIKEALEYTETLLEEIRNTTIFYEEKNVRITMTFGMAAGGVNSNIKDLLQLADENLYHGKESGRNQVVL